MLRRRLDYYYGDSVSPIQPNTLLIGLTGSYSQNGNANKNVGTNNGTATNLTYAPGKFNDGGVYNGAAWIEIINSPDFNFSNTDFAYSIFIKRGLLGTTQIFSGQANPAGTNAGTSLSMRFQPDNKIGFSAIFSDLTSNYADTGVIINDITTWHNVIFQRNGANLEVYLDGSLSYTGAGFFGTKSINNPTTKWSFGRPGEFTSVYFNGMLDEINWWVSRKLTLLEITQLQTYPYPFN